MLLVMANDPSTVSDPLIQTKNENGIQSFQWFDSLLEKQKFSFKQVFLLFSVYLILGTLCFFLITYQLEGKQTNRRHPLLRCGYGDLLPHITLAKLVACIYVLIGLAFVYVVEKQEYLLVKAIHINDKLSALMRF